jgi:hypothetical protein
VLAARLEKRQARPQPLDGLAASAGQRRLGDHAARVVLLPPQ